MPLILVLALCTTVNGCPSARPSAPSVTAHGGSGATLPRRDSALVRVASGSTFVVTHGPAGALTIVFVGGLGEDHDNWRELQDSLSHDHRTVAYDRAGLGKSPAPRRLAKDASAMADELHQVIARTVRGPYLIVSHSLGCTISRVYERRYPAGLMGAVYIDPPGDQEALERRVGPVLWRSRDSAIKVHVPPMNAAQAEEFRLQNTSYRQASATGTLRPMPRVLFTATLTYPDFPASREELAGKELSHAEWLRAMPGMRQVVVPDSRHYVHNDRPRLVIAEIRHVAAEAIAPLRGGRP